MFQLKPFNTISKDEVDLPTCMFKMKSYHAEEQTTGNLQMDALEQRQEQILQDLKNLEKEVTTLQSTFQDVPKSNTQKNMAQATKQQPQLQQVQVGGIIHDMVIFANPEQPPYSLFVLHQMLLSQYTCRTAIHLHSSVKAVEGRLLNCFENGVSSERGEVQIGITLVWKDVQHGPLLVVNSSNQTPICGESNIARYLARLLQPQYDSNDIQEASTSDHWLDVASYSVIHGNTKEKAGTIRNLNSHFGKASWLVGKDFSFVDAVMWSALQCTNQISALPGNVKKWLKACETQAAFKHALNITNSQ